MKHLLHIFVLLLALSSALHAQDTAHAALKASWEKLPRDSNLAFVAAHSDHAKDAPSVFHEGTFLPGSEQSLKSAKMLDVVGPFRRNNAEYLLRLDSVGMACDSVQASHILIAWNESLGASPDVTRTREQARNRADSLCNLIRTGKATFESFVVRGITDDPGSLGGNLGNYGWFTRESSFIEIFEQSAFAHAVGETFVFESEFGFHIMQVKARSKEYQSYFAWQIMKIIDSCFHEDGVTPTVWPGGYARGSAVLDKVIAQQRLQYSSIAKPTGNGSVIVLFDISPTGSVSAVRLEFAEGLTTRQRTDITKLFMSLRGFTPDHTCSGATGQTEIYFFEI